MSQQRRTSCKKDRTKAECEYSWYTYGYWTPCLTSSASGIYATILSFLLFSMIQFRDGPFIRPHPGAFNYVPDYCALMALCCRSILENGFRHQRTIRTGTCLYIVSRRRHGAINDEISGPVTRQATAGEKLCGKLRIYPLECLGMFT